MGAMLWPATIISTFSACPSSVLFGAKIYNIIHNTHTYVCGLCIYAYVQKKIFARFQVPEFSDNNFRQPTSIIKRTTHKK